MAEPGSRHELAAVAGATAGDDGDGYAAVRGRHTVDYILRNTHQQLVALSQQADLKANIMITLSSILLSLVLTRLDNGALRWSAFTFSAFLLVALVFALLSVLPTFLLPKPLRRPAEPKPRAPDLLFFADIASLPREDYVARMATVLEHDRTVYETLVRNIHGQSRYLVDEKYRFLTISYAFFLLGVIAASIALLAYALR